MVNIASLVVFYVSCLEMGILMVFRVLVTGLGEILADLGTDLGGRSGAENTLGSRYFLRLRYPLFWYLLGDF